MFYPSQPCGRSRAHPGKKLDVLMGCTGTWSPWSGFAVYLRLSYFGVVLISIVLLHMQHTKSNPVNKKNLHCNFKVDRKEK